MSPRATARIDYVEDLLRWFGQNRSVLDINDTLIWRYINDHSRKQPKRIYRSGSKKPDAHANSRRALWRIVAGEFRADSTTNRYLAALRSMLNEAHAVKDPHTGKSVLPIVPKVPKLDEPDDLPTPVPLWTLRKILETAPRHLVDAITLTLIYGFRKVEEP